MGSYLKNGLKVLYNYALSLLVFGLFLYVFLTIGGTNYWKYLSIYSFLMFLLAFFLIYTDEKRLAIKEKKPQYGLNPHPLKGLINGIIGFIPVAVLEAISVFLVFGDAASNRFKELALNTLMGPLYFIIKLFGERPEGYIAASLVIPIIAMLGYLAGYYGIDLIKRMKKEKANPDKNVFQKSPWNPTRKVSPSGVKKKAKQAK